MKRVNISIIEKYKALQKIEEGESTKKSVAEEYPANIRSWWRHLEDVFRRLEDVFHLRLQRTSSKCLQDVLIKTNIFALLIRLQKMSSRRLQDDLIKTIIFVLAIHLQDVFKTFSRRFQDVLQKLLQDIFRMSCKDFFKTLSRRIIRLNCLPRSHFWEIFGQCRKFLKFYHKSMVLVFAFTTSFSCCLQKRF